MDNTRNVMDTNGEGTHISGIIARVAPNVKIMPIKIYDANGNTSVTSIVRGIEYAKKMGAKLLYTSVKIYVDKTSPLGDYLFADPKGYNNIYEAIRTSGMLCISPSGDLGEYNPIVGTLPAYFPLDNILSVHAIDSSSWKPAFSQYDSFSVDIGAPGVDIHSTLPDGNFGLKSGTSMSAAFAAGVASLVMSTGINDPVLIKKAILYGCTRTYLYYNVSRTDAFLNAYSAVNYYTRTISDTTAPVVVKSNPALNAKNTSRKAYIEITFSEEIVKGENFPAITFLQLTTTAKVCQRMTYKIDKNKLIITSPDSIPLQKFAKCILTIPKGAVKDLNDNDLSADYSLTFYTGLY